MDADLLDLLMAWHGTELDPARQQALLDRLVGDESFRLAFVAEVRLLGMLRAVQSPESRWLRLEDELGWSAQGRPLDGEQFADRVVGRLDATPAEVAPEAPSIPVKPPSRRRRLGGSALALAASLLALAAGVSWWVNRAPGTVPSGREVVVGPAHPRFPQVATTDGLAMLVRLDAVRWESGAGPNPTEGDVLPAGRYRIAAGRARLTMLTGVELDVEGPADLELVGWEKVICHRGRIRASVPAGSEGFLVLGPSSAIVDLGTEFGVNVGEDGRMHGQIFRGRLEAALLNESGTSRRSYFLDSTRPNATKAFEVDPRANRIAAVAESADFPGPTEPATPPLALMPPYRDAVLASKPWGYWRFEALDNGTVRNEVPHGPPLRAVGPLQIVAMAGGNHAIEFPASPEPQKQLLQLSEEWRPTWGPGFALEFWVNSRTIAHASLACLISPVGTDHHVFLLETTSRNRLTIHKPASFRLLHRFPPGWEGGENIYSDGPSVPSRWHHIVGQIQRESCELFVDGALAATMPVSVDHADVPCQFLLGRLSDLDGTGLSIDRPFVGRMDEVALYDHPLSLDEIREHAGRSDPRPAR